ncbi:MAG: type I glutamate--ammonia ligase [Gammaproteobacteria bacterium]
MAETAKDLIAQNKIKWIDMRFTDMRGKNHHVTLPASEANDSFFKSGRKFDGSSISGWRGIESSDMVLIPDQASAVVDPFSEENTLILFCDVIEPESGENYNRCPRSIGKKAIEHLRATGIADDAFFGPEPEFFVFDGIRWNVGMSGSSYEIESTEAAWNSNAEYEDGNMGHRPRVKGGYFPVPPVDSLMELRTAMCAALESMGMKVELHHHEVGTAGQCEIGTLFNSLHLKADELQNFKYCIHRVAEDWGHTATFMPKPIVGDNGNGMHVHQSLIKDGKNIFSGDGYANLSETALFYIGGIIKNAHALNAFTNSSTNSYKRLIPGFEAPTKLCYSSRNRSAAIRIPWEENIKATRIEARFPDASGNPYFTFAALMMAGLDGIQNKIHPGDPSTLDLFNLTPEQDKQIPSVASSLDVALDSLDRNREFLLQGDVFTNDLIDAYIKLKSEEVDRIRMETHPVEFDMYYSC